MSIENPNFVHAACRLVQQVGPTLTPSRGFNAVLRNGAGDYTLTLDEAVDEAESAVYVNGGNAVAASGLTAFGIVRTDTTIRVTSLQEGGGGAVSALADLGNLCIMVVRFPTGN